MSRPAPCTLCGTQDERRPYPACPVCHRCYSDLSAGRHRRHEAALRAGPLGDGPSDPLWEAA
jgi:hypothetical protein